MTPEHFPKTTFRAAKTSDGLGMASLDGYLSAFDNNFVLNSSAVAREFMGQLPCIRPKLIGDLDPETLLQRLHEIDANVSLEAEDWCKVLRLPSLNAEIRLMDDGSRTQIFCDSKEGRQKLFDVLSSCLKELCSM